MFELLSSASILAAAAFAAPFIMNWLADNNVLFTKVKEGTAKAIMAGGSFHHFLMSHRGFHLNDPRWKNDGSGRYLDDPVIGPWGVVANNELALRGLGSYTPENFDSRGWLMRKLGLYWVGIPPFRSVYQYSFSWNEELVGTAGRHELWHRDDKTEFVYTANFPYMVLLDSAETSDRLPLDGVYQLVVRVTNPFRALFDTENWFQTITALANRQARNYVGQNKYADLVAETKKDGDSSGAGSFSTSIVMLNTRLPGEDIDTGGVLRQNGVRIVSADLQQLEITGANKQAIVDATLRAYTAEQEAIATRTAGDAEAAATLAKGTAAAAVTRLQGEAVGQAYGARLKALKKFGDLSGLLLQTDAMSAEGPGRTVVWANNPLIAARPGLAEALEHLGIKTPEDLKAILAAKEA